MLPLHSTELMDTSEKPPVVVEEEAEKEAQAEAEAVQGGRKLHVLLIISKTFLIYTVLHGLV